MNKSVEHYISELLYLHDCVIIPDFGGFVGNRKSAQLNRTTGLLTPPSKQILFNRKLITNDGLLILHIANKECITQEEANKNVTIFVNESNTKLDSSKILRLAKIGLFTIGKDGNIIFLQDSAINYSLDSFGFKPSHKKSIIRISNSSKELGETVHRIKNAEKNYKMLFRAAAVIIPLVTLAYLSISQHEKINNVYTQMATFNPFTKNEISENIINPSLEKEIDVTVEKSEIEAIDYVIIEDLEKSPVITAQNKYYIIAGAFAEEKNANKMVNKLKAWNYNAEILRGGRLLRVCYDSFIDRKSAILALNNIKKENPNVWLLTK